MTAKSLIALLFVMAILNAQDWGATPNFNANEGFALPHIYADDITLTPATGQTLVNFTSDFNVTFDTQPFSSSESIYVATAFLDFTIDTSATASKYLEVGKATLSADRTQFLLNLVVLDPTTIGATATPFNRIRMSFIVIGSQFEGFPVSGVQSSYVYAKNSALVTVDPANDTKQFDFTTSASPSPFNYLPTATLGHRCGFINGNIEVQGCTFNRFYVFVTGFSYTSSAGTTNNDLKIAATLLLSTASTSTTYEDYFFVNGVKDDLFKSTATDTTVGLPIKFTNRASAPTTSILMKVQLSFLYVGIRDFNSATYPAQSPVLQDNFIHFGAVSGIPPLTTPITAATATAFNLINGVSSIYNTIDAELAHAFCGLSLYINRGDNGVTAQPSVTSSYAFTAAQITNTITSNNVGDVAHSCAIFKSREGCTSSVSVIPLVMTNDRITNVNDFGVDTSGNANLDVTIGPTNNANIPNAMNPTVKFKFNIPSASVMAKITLKFDRPAGVVAFRGIVATTATGGFQVTDSIKLTVFGKVVIDKSFPASDANQLTQIFNVYSTTMTDDTLVFQYGGSHAAATAVLAGFIEFGLIGYDRVLDGVACSTMCTARTGFDVGIQAVVGAGFADVPICLFCDSSKSLVFKEDTGTCDCDINFHDNDNDGTCARCTDTLCNSCASSSALCDVCVSNSNGSPCGCNNGFFPSTTQTALCQACNIACDSCSSATSCTACKDSNNTREAANLGCVCKAGFFDNNTLICATCNMECQTCSGTPSNCVTCNTAGNFMLSGTTCVCMSGFYLLRTDTSITCQPCDSSCKECSGSSLICTECDTAKAFRAKDINNNCVCIDGYIELQGVCVDTTCTDIDPNCQSCGFDPSTGKRQCLSCMDNRVVDGGVCKCKVGFYEKADGTCAKCGEGCAICGVVENDLKCFQCALNAVQQNADGTCTCPASTVLVDAAGTLFCKACSSECRECNNTFDFCTSCNPPSVLMAATGKCMCPNGTYTSPAGQCVQCMMFCEMCTDGMSCDKCAPLYIFDTNTKTCSLNCPRGTFKVGNECQNCSMGCEDCINGFTCITCKTGFNVFLGGCESMCPPGTFADVDNICYACVSPCRTCSGPGTNQCDSCVSGFVYFNRECRTDCIDGTYFADGSCLVCSNRCKTCTGISTQCTSCFENQFLFKNNCFNECPAAVVNGVCTDRCPDGSYLDGNVCRSCSTECETCEGSASNCLRCSSGFKSYKGSCTATCPMNTLDQGAFCADCDPTCNGCSGATFLCDQCATGLVKSGLRCIERCLDGQYLDATTQSCEFCGSGCKTCLSPTQCIECTNPLFTSINGECRETCPPGSRRVGTECVCTFGVKHLGACVSSCPEGFYAVNGECQACLAPCKACFGSATTCLNCREGFELDATTRECKRESSCPFGQFLSSSGCKRICEANMFFHKSACVFMCPTGFMDNTFGGCVEKTNPTICPMGEFQKGSVCVKTCDTQFFANEVTRTCDRCISGCMICVNAISCFQCDAGKVLMNGMCSDSIGCQENEVQYNGMCMARCPAGTYRTGMTCMRGCRDGTFFYQNLCYPTCPTGKRTADACVTDCTNIPNCIETP